MHEAEGVFVLKDVQAVAMGAGKTSAANRAERAGSAGCAAGTIAAGLFRVKDLSDALLNNIADGRRKFTAGMNLTICEKGHEIECRAAAVARASTEWGKTLIPTEDIDKIVLDPHDGVSLRCSEVRSEKGKEPSCVRQSQICTFTNHRKTIKVKNICFPAEYVGEREHLVKVLACEC
jgi:hypothetical protein